MDNVFPSKHPLVMHKLTKLRNRKTEPKKFRELIREIAALLVYEATNDLLVAPTEIETPLEPIEGASLQQKIGLVPILRAGLGMVDGIWGLMPSAEVWHIGLFRDEQTCGVLQQTPNRTDGFSVSDSRSNACHWWICHCDC